MSKMPTTPTDDRFEELLTAVMLDDFCEADLKELEGLLRASPERIDRYVEGALLRANLDYLCQAISEARNDGLIDETFAEERREHVVTLARRPRATPKSPRREPDLRWLTWGIYGGTAGFAILFATIALFLYQEPLVIPLAATITTEVDAQWTQNFENNLIPVGSLLTLQRGVASLELASGSTLTLEAPTSVYFLSGSRCELVDGRLVARQGEQARSLNIVTQRGTYSDLGTELGVASSTQEERVQVYDGKIMAASSLSRDQIVPDDGRLAVVTLTAGMATRLDDHGLFRDEEFQLRQFVRAAQFDWFARVMAYQEKLLSLKPLLRIPFDLRNTLQTRGDVLSLGKVVSMQNQLEDAVSRETGWMHNPSPGISLSPHLTSALHDGPAYSFVAWIKPESKKSLSKFPVGTIASGLPWIDSLVVDEVSNTELLGNSPELDQIQAKIIEINGGPNRLVGTGDRSLEFDGQWRHVAVIMQRLPDQMTWQISLYLDGALRTEQLCRPKDNRGQALYLGGDPERIENNFVGGLDEVLLFDRVIDAGTIQRLYEEGTALARTAQAGEQANGVDAR